MLQGGCYCGRIRYEVSGTPFHKANCHCSICRRTTGAPFVAWFSVRPSEFLLLSGQPALFRSSAKATRGFCAHCGTQLTLQGDDWPDEIDVTTCSLDHPEQVPPTDHIHTSSKLRWIQLSDGLPEHQEVRPSS